MKNDSIIPPILRKGDKVAVISPSGMAEPEAVQRGIAVIEGWGLRVATGASALASDGQFAGTDALRLADIQLALDDPEVKAVFCSRGGYGLSRIIDRIDFSSFAASPKWIVGFSDVTVLHTWIASLFGIATIHGEMPVNYGNPQKTDRTLTTVRELLFGGSLTYEWEGAVTNPARAQGILTGGNLSLLYSLAGTVARPDTEGNILFIEDTGEQYYSVDRMLTSLKLAGMLSNLAGLLVGDFSNMQDGRIPYGKSVTEIVNDIAGGFGYPVWYGFPTGHCNDNMALALGCRVSIVAAGSGTVMS
ncbi:MAG: LD-carboxypeptidase, partial [Bacteroidales bacterium]|nr:LD-carboxypeptidase [Bacteroidales bacterium]